MTRFGIRAFAVCCLATAVLAAPYVPAPPKAHIYFVDVARKPVQTVSYPGAGLRPPHMGRGTDALAETVRVEWLAHSPGIPPGAMVMLETATDRQPVLKTRILKLSGKTEGNQTTCFEIPPLDTRLAGPIGRWRVRIIWLGRVLATRTSTNWDATGGQVP